MHIGLIGGIGPAATDYYYRGLIRALGDSGKPLDVTIAHADAPTVLSNMASGDTNAQAAIFTKLIDRLKAAGARAAAVTSIAGHFCIDEVNKTSNLPLINIIDEVAAFINNRNYKKVGLIGTQKVMQSKFYGGLPSVDIVLPTGTDLERVHQSYVDMATSGQVTDQQRAVFFKAGRQLVEEQGCEAVMLGGTDLFLAFNGSDCGFNVIDCAKVHIDALVKAAGDIQDHL